MEAYPKVSYANEDGSKSGKKNSAAKSKKPKGSFLTLPWINTTTSNNKKAIIEDMNRDGSIGEYQEQNTRKRVKVDLDDKTKTFWKLLPEDMNNLDVNGIDEEKTRWKEERNLFSVRVDSFIAHMCPVQGNRCFSLWKGSVVDSVVGAFLSQNVSDHLSCSAFMSLVACYPLESKYNFKRGFEEEKTVEGHICSRNLTILNDIDITCEAHAVHKQNAPKKDSYDWDSLRKQVEAGGSKARQRTANTMDLVDWGAVRCANVSKIAEIIKFRGMNNILAKRIKDFLDRLVSDHGSIDLEWIRCLPPDKAKKYLLSIRGLGLKSVECIRLLTVHHPAFPVDTNVARIAVRLGWVPLQPYPHQLHLIEEYPTLKSVHEYLWPRLCKLNQKRLYELHYHMITFGKVLCEKKEPNCNACPLRGECKYFASASESTKLPFLRREDRGQSNQTHQDPQLTINSSSMPPLFTNQISETNDVRNGEPIVEIQASPEQEPEQIYDIEDAFSKDPNEIPRNKLNMEEFTQTLHACTKSSKELQEGDMLKALVVRATTDISTPPPKLKNVS